MEKPTTCIWTTTIIGEAKMISTHRHPASVGEVLVEEFIRPLGITQQKLADAMGVPRKHVNELCRNKRSISIDTALILAKVFRNSPEFWLNLQRRIDLWEAMNDQTRRKRIEQARSIA